MRRPPSSSISAAQPDGVAGLAGNIDLSLPAQPSIVVLPFDTDADAERRNVALGLTHDVMTRIARPRPFFVTARGSAFRFHTGSPHLPHVPPSTGLPADVPTTG